MEDFQMEKPKSSKRALWITLAIVIIIVLAITAYVYGKNSSSKTPQQPDALTAVVESATATLAVSSPTATATSSTDASATWKTYTNDANGFSFKYPSDWTIAEGGSQEYPRKIVSVRSNTANSTKIWPGSGVHYNDQIIVNKETESSIPEWITKRLAGGYSDNSKVVTINGAEFTEIVPGSDPEYLAELKINNSTLYSIIFDWASGRDDITPTQEQILSTFQFTK